MIEALERGIQAGRAAADRAERIESDWIQIAVNGIRAFARRANKPFTIEQARQHCIATPGGADARAWGSITVQAVRAGYIEKTGRFEAARSSNGSLKPLYRRGRKA